MSAGKKNPTRETAAEVLEMAGHDQPTFRRMVKEQSCPFCERGPFKRLSNHTWQAHGINQWDIRIAGGFTREEPICDPSYSDKMRSMVSETSLEALPKGRSNLISGWGQSASEAARKENGRRTGARQRALLRLAQLHEDEYRSLLEEELRSEGR